MRNCRVLRTGLCTNLECGLGRGAGPCMPQATIAAVDALTQFVSELRAIRDSNEEPRAKLARLAALDQQQVRAGRAARHQERAGGCDTNNDWRGIFSTGAQLRQHQQRFSFCSATSLALMPAGSHAGCCDGPSG